MPVVNAQGGLDRHPPLHSSEADMLKGDISTRLSAPVEPMPTANLDADLAGTSLAVPNGGSAMPIALSRAASGDGDTMALLAQPSTVLDPLYFGSFGAGKETVTAQDVCAAIDSGSDAGGWTSMPAEAPASAFL